MCQYPGTLNQILNSLPPLLMANTVLKSKDRKLTRNDDRKLTVSYHSSDRKLTRKFAEQCKKKKINVHLYIVRY